MVNGNGTGNMPPWLPSAVVVTLLGGMFSAGVWVGNQQTAVQLAAVRETLHSHIESVDRELTLQFASIERRLQRIEEKVDARE